MSRYNSIKIKTIKDENRSGQSIGTSYLPDLEENNSDVLLIATQGDRCDLFCLLYTSPSPRDRG